MILAKDFMQNLVRFYKYFVVSFPSQFDTKLSINFGQPSLLAIIESWIEVIDSFAPNHITEKKGKSRQGHFSCFSFLFFRYELRKAKLYDIYKPSSICYLLIMSVNTVLVFNSSYYHMLKDKTIVTLNLNNIVTSVVKF